MAIYNNSSTNTTPLLSAAASMSPDNNNNSNNHQLLFSDDPNYALHGNFPPPVVQQYKAQLDSTGSKLQQQQYDAV
ncbi:hypothetical protein EZV62_016689 [Acer yangbiense]|uniref:Uncharacterized protein n=1 Tax=Acer yangbiense TaxID=1000413 RepID=A0A5C7HP50_9ROSI|nr:hypothetical protein EZV62_016689 [Acer yangbiense]